MNEKKNLKLSNIHLIYIVIVLLGIGGFILISSGLFDTVKVDQNLLSRTNTAKQESTVDLNAVNEINKLEETVKNNPNNHEALLSLAHLLNDNGFYERAVEKYEKYLNTYKNEPDVIVDMGVCYFELKKYDKAIEVIKQAIKVEPKHQIAHFNLGIVTLAKGNAAEAHEWWKKARDINPNANIGKKAEELLKTKI